MAQQKAPWSDTPGGVLCVEVIYLLILLALGFIYCARRQWLAFVPDYLGTLPTGVPWFGALGAVIISLVGTVDHWQDWDPHLKYWHFTRPLVGASLGIISVLIVQTGILATTARPVTPTNPASIGSGPYLLGYLAAFAVGYREETFRELIKKLLDVILTPGDHGPHPMIKDINPSTGKVAGGEKVTIAGSGFASTRQVKFGPLPASDFQVDSDGQITVTTPEGTEGKVSVTITTRVGSVTGGKFIYTQSTSP